MRCLLCSDWSIAEHICKPCQREFLSPKILHKKLYKDIELISFYSYSDIEQLLKLKHTPLGYHIYKLLAKLTFKKFAQSFDEQTIFRSIAVDENVKSGYSHTAILNHALKCSAIKPAYNKLRQKSDLHYSEHNLDWRKKHPRDFYFNSFKGDKVILVDDIKTTGLTLKSAINILEKSNKEVQFVMTLADVRN